MTSMNRHVDERITFTYPSELRCTWHPRSRSFHLRRGAFHVIIGLPEEELWESLFKDAQDIWQVPRGSVDAQGEPIPTHQQWVDDYAMYGFQGRARSTLC